MTESQTLDDRIYRAAFWAAVVLIVAGVLSVFFPLDAPEGAFADRMVWYSSNVGAFVVGWAVQMVAMLALAGARMLRFSTPFMAAFIPEVPLASFGRIGLLSHTSAPLVSIAPMVIS